MRFNADHERRHSSRIDFSSLFTGEELPPGGSPRQKRCFKGRIENISDGGVCVIAKQRPKDSQVIHGLIKLPALSIIIPTLMEVRWTLPHKREFRIGLKFLL